MTWVRMDDRWPFNRKIRRVEPLDRLMWAVSIAYTSEQNTDGVLDGCMVEFVASLAGVQNAYDAADRLVTAGLWELDGGRWKVHDYLTFNLSREEREAERKRKAAAGQLGGLARARSRNATSEASSSSELAARKQAAKQKASKALASNVPVTGTTPSSSSLAASASGSAADGAESTPGRTDDDVAALDPRALAALELVAPQVAAAKGARNPRSYARTVAADPERQADLQRLAHANPDREAAWLAREHLGQAHPVEPCGNCRSSAHRTEACPIPPMERS